MGTPAVDVTVARIRAFTCAVCMQDFTVTPCYVPHVRAVRSAVYRALPACLSVGLPARRLQPKSDVRGVGAVLL